MKGFLTSKGFQSPGKGFQQGKGFLHPVKGFQLGTNLNPLMKFNLGVEGHSFVDILNSLSSTIYYRVLPETTYNGAVAGTNIAASVARAAVLDTQIKTETDNYKNVLVVYSGVNDMSNTAGVGTTTYNALKSYVQSRLTAGWKVFAYTMTPSTFNTFAAGFESERVIFNNLMRNDLALLSGVYILDTDTLPQLNDPTNTDYYIDKLHPTRMAVDLMANLLCNKLRQVYHAVTYQRVDNGATMTLTAQGDGTGVLSFILYAGQKLTLTLSGAARFYTDAAGTLGESSTFEVLPLANRNIYIRLSTGTDIITFSKNELKIIASINSGTNGPKLGGNIEQFNELRELSTISTNLLTGDLSVLKRITTATLGNTSGITFTDLSKHSDLSNFHIGIVTHLTSDTVNNILAAFVANKDVPRSSASRTLYLVGDFTTGAPTGQGITDKATLQAYRTPFNDATKSLWTVTTR